MAQKASHARLDALSVSNRFKPRWVILNKHDAEISIRSAIINLDENYRSKLGWYTGDLRPGNFRA